MPNERLELTFTGLCVLVVTGKAGEVNPSSVEVLMVDESGGHHAHLPRMSFRGIDLGFVSTGEDDEMPLHVIPDGQEIMNLAIPSGVRIAVSWESGAVDTQNTMAWNGSPISMHKVPDLLDFNVTEIHRDGTNTAATVTLPFGTFEARRIVRARDAEMLWSFPSLPPRVYANQVTLVSQAQQGMALNIQFAGRTYSFLSGDGELPLRISLTNLPATGRLIEPPIGEGQSPPHLNSYRKMAKTETGTGFRGFSRAPGATRQGTICPTVRAHV